MASNAPAWDPSPGNAKSILSAGQFWPSIGQLQRGFQMSHVQDHGRTSISSAEVSPVRTSAGSDRDEALAESGPLFGGTSLESSSKSRRRGSSSKTSRQARVVGCITSDINCTCLAIERAPWGLPPQTWERRTFGDVSSLLPTPTASSYGSNQGGALGRVGKARLSLEAMAKRGYLPTPVVSRSTHNIKGDRTTPGLGMVAETEGRLSPRFVEWMMGFPDDWTRLESEPSATRSSRNARRSSAK